MKKTLLLALFICAFIRLKAQSFEFSLQAGSGLSRFSGSSSASNSTIAGAVGGKIIKPNSSGWASLTG
jgi:hypothetical protein